MSVDLENDGALRSRRKLRFASDVKEQLYDPDSSNDKDADHYRVPSKNNEENLFRVPLPPRAPAPREPMTQTTNTAFVDNFRPSLSPSSSVTKEKYLQKLKKLKERRTKDLEHRKAKNEKDTEEVVTKKVDISLSEQSFLGTLNQIQNHVPSSEIRISDISSIHPFETSYAVNLTGDIFNGPVCSTPFRAPAPLRSKTQESSLPKPAPSVKAQPPTSIPVASAQDLSLMYETYEEKIDRQMKALSIWCNMILKCDQDVAEFDLGKSRKEADQKLQDLLTKPSKIDQANQEISKRFTYKDFLRKQERALVREKASKCYHSTDIPIRIREMVSKKKVAIRDDCEIYNNISLKKTLLRVFLSFNPMWLHLGMETVFNETIDIGEGDQYAAVIYRFISSRLFTDPSIMKNKKFAQGTVKMLVTPAGREALNCHFLTHSCQFFYFVEFAKASGILEHNPRMFNKSSSYKCLEDVFSELSREILSASSKPLHKELAKVGFKPSFKQGFFDNFDYRVTGFSDLHDGIILGKMIEIIAHIHNIVGKMREPRGDRLRKIGNMKVVFDAAKQSGFDLGALKPDTIVACNKEAILEILWRFVGVYVLDSGHNDLRRLSLDIASRRLSQIGCASDNASTDELVVHICRQIGDTLGIEIESIDDLKDGRLLAGAWRLYNPTAPDVIFYPGTTLYKQVVSAAESELDVPIGLHGAIQLFAYMYLSRLFYHHRLHSAATRIQRAWRSHCFRKFVRGFAATRNSTVLSSSYHASDSSCEAQRTYIIQERECAATLLALAESFVPSTETGESDTVIIDNSGYHANGDAECIILDNDYCFNPEVDYDQHALKIQSAVRGWLVRRRNPLKSMKEDILRHNRAAATIQAAVRGWIIRKMDVIYHLKEERRLIKEKREKAALVIQAAVRGWLVRRQHILDKLREFAVKEAERKYQAAIFIQKHVRGWFVRKSMILENLREQKAFDYLQKYSAATKIQSVFRGWFVRKQQVLLRLREEKLLLEAKKHQSAIVIQSAVRGWLIRKLYVIDNLREERRQLEKERLNAVIILQAYTRGWLVRRNDMITLLREKKIKLEMEARTRAIIKIQTVARRWLAVRKLELLRQQHISKVHAVIVIQSGYRGWRDRRTCNRLRREIFDANAERLRIEAEEVERLRIEAEEVERLRIEAEEAERLRIEAEEAERLRIEAEEAERLRIEAEEAERLRIEAEEAMEAERLRIEAEEAERLRIEAEEAERLRIEAEEAMEAERLRIEAEEAERLRIEAEEAERLRIEAEEAMEAERLRIEAEEAERLRIEAEEAERLRIEAEETERLRIEAEEAERLRIEAEEAERLQQEYERQELCREAAEKAELLAHTSKNTAATFIQKHVRGWLVRRDKKIAKETFHMLENHVDMVNIQSPAEGLISLRSIFEEVRQLKREQHSIAKILDRIKREIVLSRRKPLKYSAEVAALMIQRWYRGVRVRKQYRAELEKRSEAMEFYRRMVFEQNGPEEDLHHKSALERLTIYSDFLFDERMYAKKVGAYGINRLTSLTPYFVIEFVHKLQGVAVILDAIDNLDRGMYSTEVLEILSETLSRISKCKDFRIQEALSPLAEDCVKILFHMFHAHYKNIKITTNSVKGLVALHERPGFKAFYTKLPFYVKAAQRRFERLPTNSPEVKNLKRLQQLM